MIFPRRKQKLIERTPTHSVKRCPRCNTIVDQMPACPTGYAGQRWHEHYPPCGDAILYFCLAMDCKWEYLWGMNPDNPKHSKNEENRPKWLQSKEFWKTLVNPRCTF